MSINSRVKQATNHNIEPSGGYYIITPIGGNDIKQFSLSLDYNLNIVQKKDRPEHKDTQFIMNNQYENMFTTIYITQDNVELPIKIYITNPLYSFREWLDPDTGNFKAGSVTQIRIPEKGPDGTDYNLGFTLDYMEGAPENA